LCSDEREVISRELAVGRSIRSIGRSLGRDHSMLSREIARNGGLSAYRAIPAQDRAVQQRGRPKTRLLESHRRLHDAVNEGLAKK
jgi:transposase, IS30 family